MKPGDLVKPFTKMIYLYSDILMSVDEKHKIQFLDGTVGIILETKKLNTTNTTSMSIHCKILSPGGVGWTNSLLLETVS